MIKAENICFDINNKSNILVAMRLRTKYRYKITIVKGNIIPTLYKRGACQE